MSAPISYDQFRKTYDAAIVSDAFFEGAAYYEAYRDRYWNTLKIAERYLPRQGARVLDVGSGQFAVLLKQLLGVDADVTDIETRFTEVLQSNGIGFLRADLTTERVPAASPYDLVIMGEVIEHVPTPPHVVFANLLQAIRPGGYLLVTTPNLYRLRNLVRMATGQRIFDIFRMPGPDDPLGHFIEYAKDQMDWHMSKAGYDIELSELMQLSHGGASLPAKLARQVLRPLFRARPLWRDNIVIVGRRPQQTAAA